MRKKVLIAVLITALTAGSIGFWSGVKTGEAHAPAAQPAEIAIETVPAETETAAEAAAGTAAETASQTAAETAAETAAAAEVPFTPTGQLSPRTDREHIVSGVLYQISAECLAQMIQSYRMVCDRVDAMTARCEDPEQPDWTLETAEDGSREMYYQGRRVALISDIDDTLVLGAPYSCDIVGSGGDWTNASFARYLMSDACQAMPGAAECMQYCADAGIEVFYLTNRYDQGYKIGQSDSCGSYEETAQTCGRGAYLAKDGTEIGVSICQLYGKTMYELSLESMQRLGFPVDPQHLIVNDLKINGPSKEAGRQAIREGSEAYPSGQRAEEGDAGIPAEVRLEPHEVVLMLGDQLADFTDDFDTSVYDAVARNDRIPEDADRFGEDWIVFPNAMYGAPLDTAKSYGVTRLMEHYSYLSGQE